MGPPSTTAVHFRIRASEDASLKTTAWDAYPGEFARSFDVDGLRSMCVLRLRVAVRRPSSGARTTSPSVPGPSGPTPRATSLTIATGLPRRKPGSPPYPPRTSRSHT